ncbi:MAG TPA: biotin transporter BioY [Balneolaceae bacterium]
MRAETKWVSLTLCAVFVALTAVFAQIEIPLPYVPISGQTLAVGLTAIVVGSRLGALTMLCYVALGAAGAPVFAGFGSGMQVLAGPTGGYILGFIFAAFVTGFMLEKNGFTLKMALFANIIGMMIILIFGVIRLKYVTGLGWNEALAAGVYPFVITGVIKAFLAGGIGIAVRRKLEERRSYLRKL